MSKGRVKFYRDDKGFGVIKSEDGGKDILFLASHLAPGVIGPLREGDMVSYELTVRRDGRPAASNVIKVEDVGAPRFDDVQRR